MSPRRSCPSETAGRDKAHLDKIIAELTAIQNDLMVIEQYCAPLLTKLELQLQASAVNLLHFLALRHRDIRPLQGKIANLGLSSRGRAEAHVLACVYALRKVLHHLTGIATPDWGFRHVLDFFALEGLFPFLRVLTVDSERQSHG
jgi:pyruvate kinase